MQGEFMFLAVICVPTFLAFIAWLFHHTRITNDEGIAPANYWGSYSGAAGPSNYGGIRLPETKPEEHESASHIHTIGVHP